jgi:serine/threonine-protein kinase RsbW
MLQGNILTVSYRDGGQAFNPLEQAEPDISQGADDRPIGGLGIHLVRNMMDSLEYCREARQNVLIMKKKVS